MDAMTRIEQALAAAIEQSSAAVRTPRAGARPGWRRRSATRCSRAARGSGRGCAWRWRRACGDDDPALADAAAASIELLHCASLVHDDLPCFDDARAAPRQALGPPRLRRAAGGAGRRRADRARVPDAGRADGRAPAAPGAAAADRSAARSACRPASSPARPGSARHAWRSTDYQRAKTGALFAAATMAGASAAGADAGPWRTFGERLGEAYQVADDIRDVAADPEELGKPVGRDAALGRPSAAARARARGRDAAPRATGGRGGRLDPCLPGREPSCGR